METLKSIAPILYCSDMYAAKAFWEPLGWKIMVDMPNYLIVGNSGKDFHYSSDIPNNKGLAYVEPANVVALHQSYKEAGAAVDELIDQPYGMREFHLTDPDGNVFTFGSIIENA